MEVFFAALTLGFLGSLHCVGMCGPIALALPVVSNTRLSRVMGVILYNTGRIITYSTLGLIFGLFGKTFIIAGYQQALSIALGVLILAIVIATTLLPKHVSFAAPWLQPVTFVKRGLSKFFQRKSYSSLLITGILNGLLPCGLVYTGVAGAIAVAEPLNAALFMAFFGLGTVPAMLALALAGQKISIEVRNKFRNAVPVFVSVMAVLLILRGLNLGVPYLSPELSKQDCTKHHCCHK